MKKNLLFLSLVLSNSFLFSQNISELSFRTQYADVVPVDLNNDGALDLVVTGADVNGIGKNNLIYMNDGAGNLTEMEFTDEIPNVLNGENRASLFFYDYDGNDTLDVIMGGRTGKGIFHGNGDGTFQKTDYAVPSSFLGCAWADFNNDGLPDYVVIGEGSQGAAAIYYNNGDGTFTETNDPFTDYQFYESDMVVVDYNNDGNTDFFINSWEDVASFRFSRLFYNDGYDIYMYNPGIDYQKANGTAAWADIDGDGDLDLLFGGDGGSSSEETSDAMVRVFTNKNGVLSESQVIEGYRPLNTGGSFSFADWDNDGDYDIILTGWSDVYSNQCTHIYYNDGSGYFAKSSVSIPGVSDGGASPMDVDNDGKIDLIGHGYCGDVDGWYSFVCYNTTATVANTKPNAPTNLKVAKDVDGLVTISWDAATDNETASASLTYEIYLKKADSTRYLLSPASIVGGDNDGKRKVVRLGNAYANTSWTFKNLDGQYEWGVQAIDASYAGSTFATGTFNTENLNGIKQNPVVNVNAYPNPASTTLHVDGVNNAQAVIYAMDGHVVKSMNDFNGSIDVTELSNGLYIIKIDNNLFAKFTISK